MRPALLLGSLAVAIVVTRSSAQADPCEDLDGDGYFAGPGCAAAPLDCNDQNAAIHPGATEVCNGVDDNCDGVIDEGCASTCPDFGLTLSTIVHASSLRGQIAPADRSWGIVFARGDGTTEVATRLDGRGNELAPETTFNDFFYARHELVWTGAELAVAWGNFEGGFPYGWFFRRVGPWGKPSSDPVTLDTGESSNGSLTWNGYEFGQLWTDISSDVTQHGARLGRLGPSGDVRDSTTRLTANVDHNDVMTWNGSGYGWAFIRSAETGHQEVYFQRVAADGTLIGGTTRVTDHTGDSTNTYADDPIIRSKGPGKGYGVAWIDTHTGLGQAWFAALRDDGSVATPPGPVQVSMGVHAIAVSALDLAWTGSEFLLVWVNTDGSIVQYGRIRGARIGADGTVLEQKDITPGPSSDIFPRVAWNGSNFGILLEHANAQTQQVDLEYVSVGCNCTTDADHDGILPCGGGDCDDNDPTVGAGKSEICNDGKDNNCDGLIDCNDPTCVQSGSPPSEIGSVRFSSGKTTIAWSGDSKATAYDVARGVLGDLSDMQNFRWTSCFVSKTTLTSASADDDPKPGTGFYYIVRGRAKTCLLGTWGSPLADSTLHGCP